jgi:hypothetical protein
MTPQTMLPQTTPMPTAVAGLSPAALGPQHGQPSNGFDLLVQWLQSLNTGAGLSPSALGPQRPTGGNTYQGPQDDMGPLGDFLSFVAAQPGTPRPLPGQPAVAPPTAGAQMQAPIPAQQSGALYAQRAGLTAPPQGGMMSASQVPVTDAIMQAIQPQVPPGMTTNLNQQQAAPTPAPRPQAAVARQKSGEKKKSSKKKATAKKEPEGESREAMLARRRARFGQGRSLTDNTKN